MNRILLPSLLLTLRLAANEPPAGTPFYQIAWPEASAIAAAGEPAKWLVVADNELPKLAVYSLERTSTEAHRPAFTQATSPAYSADDIEAVTVFPWDENGDGKPEAVLHVFTASCSRTKAGKVKEERDALFAVKIDTAALAAGKEAFPAAVEYNRTLRAQLRALGGENAARPWGPVLRDSVWSTGSKPDAPNAQLTSAAGLNIEGLTVSRDSRALLLGLRSPLVNGRALVVPLTNPVGALGLGESAPQPAALSEPVLLDLGGLGIRSIEWDAAAARYLIAAGDAGEGKSFRFYTWSGEAADAPKAVSTPSALQATGIEPEGIAPVPGFKSAAVAGDGSQGMKYHEGRWVDFGAGN